MFPKLRFSLAAALFLLSAAPLTAQTNPAAPKPAVKATPAAKKKSPPKPEPAASKFELYAGYSYFQPFDTGISGYTFPKIYNQNVTASMSYFFTRHLGLQLEGTYFSDARTAMPGVASTCAVDAGGTLHCEQDQDVETAQIGLVYRFPLGRWVPYIHGLGGGLRMNGPVVNPLRWGWGGTVGGGVDYVLPFFHNHLAIRAIEFNDQLGHIDFGPLVLPAGISGGSDTINAIELSAGVVLRIGGKPEIPVALACSTTPGVVYPGDPLQAVATPSHLDPKKHTAYHWEIPGAHVPANAFGSVAIATAALAPGDYNVKVSVSQGKRAVQQASCTTTFTVHRFDPPTIACAAQSDTVLAGAPVTLTATPASPQNRTLTTSFTTTAGTLNVTGATAQLETTGLSAGPVTVTCDTTDDLGQKASATTVVAVTVPPPPVEPAKAPEPEHQQPLCTISFARDKAHPTRVDNEAKACLDEVALSLNHTPQAKLVVIGAYTPHEKQKLAVSRAQNTKLYLSKEKGIDATRIDTMMEPSPKPDTENILLPPGAIFDKPEAAAITKP